MSEQEDGLGGGGMDPNLLERLIDEGRKLAMQLKHADKEDRWGPLSLLPHLLDDFAPHQQAAMSYFLREILAYHRRSGEQVSLQDYVEYFDDALVPTILDSFRLEALDAFSDAWKNGEYPRPETFLPEIPEGYDLEDGFGPLLYEELLRSYCILYRQREKSGDLLTACWEKIPSRRRPYTRGLCRVFSLPLPGEAVDKYELKNLVGVGGMGVVYLALNRGVKRRVALKLMRPDCERRERFRQEGRTHCKIDDMRVVVIRDGDLRQSAEQPYFTMDYAEGGQSLSDMIDGPNPPTGKELAKLLMTVADAVEVVHQYRFLHCDLKPGNVLISKKAGPLLSDLGLSRRLKEGQTAEPEPFAGTPAYTSPEQARGECLTPRSDVWGLGAILYRSLTGRAPFRKLKDDETDEETLRRITDEPVVPPRDAARRMDFPTNGERSEKSVNSS